MKKLFSYFNLRDLDHICGIDDPNDYNKLNFPIYTTDSIEVFNRFVKHWNSRCKRGFCTYGIKLTPSGSISHSEDNTISAYEVFPSQLGAELLVCSFNSDLTAAHYRIQYRTLKKFDESGEIITGRKAFTKLCKMAKEKDNCDIRDYFIDNGSEVKKTIEKPYIECLKESYLHTTFKNCHHLDINSSYPSGICDILPINNTIKFLYDNRKLVPEYKLILNASIGYFQSDRYFNAALANVSKHCIEKNNRKIDAMIKFLKDTGRKPLLLNTDGIWYQGEPVDFNSKELGEWKMDHTNCKLRIKSKGAYEFMENGKYYPVVRGYTQLDKVSSRENWKWGDIYNLEADPIIYSINPETHYIEEEHND